MSVSVKEIIEQVRLSIDEEKGSSDYIDTYMDNIIKAKIDDAMRWVCMYADGALLGGSGDTGGDNPTIRSYKYEPGEEDNNHYADSDDAPEYDENGVFTLPYDFLRLIRVRVSSWNKGVSKTIDEDSEEYLMESDVTSKSDASCPKAALISDYPNQLEIFPTPAPEDTIYLTFAVSPSATTIESENSTVAVPPKVKTAFIYYLAYLVMCAYNDTTKASTMLGVAKAHIGGASGSTDAG